MYFLYKTYMISLSFLSYLIYKKKGFSYIFTKMSVCLKELEYVLARIW